MRMEKTAKFLGWRVQQNGEEAKNIFSNALKSRVIRLEGEGGPWILGAVSGDMAWSNKKEKWISWKMLLGDRYTIYIPVTTKNGTRYLFYNDSLRRILRHGFEWWNNFPLGLWGRDYWPPIPWKVIKGGCSWGRKVIITGRKEYLRKEQEFFKRNFLGNPWIYWETFIPGLLGLFISFGGEGQNWVSPLDWNYFP